MDNSVSGLILGEMLPVFPQLIQHWLGVVTGRLCTMADFPSIPAFFKDDWLANFLWGYPQSSGTTAGLPRPPGPKLWSSCFHSKRACLAERFPPSSTDSVLIVYFFLNFVIFEFLIRFQWVSVKIVMRPSLTTCSTGIYLHTRQSP